MDALLLPVVQYILAELCRASAENDLYARKVQAGVKLMESQHGRDVAWRLEQIIFDIGVGRLVVQLVPKSQP